MATESRRKKKGSDDFYDYGRDIGEIWRSPWKSGADQAAYQQGGSFAANLDTSPPPSEFDSFLNRRLGNAGEMTPVQGEDGTVVNRFQEGEFKGKSRKEVTDELAKEHRYGKAGTAARKAGELQDRLDGKVAREGGERSAAKARGDGDRGRSYAGYTASGKGRTQGGVEHVDDFYGRQSEKEKQAARRETGSAVAAQKRRQVDSMAADVGRGAAADENEFQDKLAERTGNKSLAGERSVKYGQHVADQFREKHGGTTGGGSGFAANIGESDSSAKKKKKPYAMASA